MVLKVKKPKPPPKPQPKPQHAEAGPATDAVIADLRSATDATSLTAALARAQDIGLSSSRSDDVKQAKRRLFACNSGVAVEALPVGTQRKRSPEEVASEVAPVETPQLARKKKRRTEAGAVLDETAPTQPDQTVSQKSNSEFQVRVGNVSKLATDDELQTFFEDCGEIAELVVTRNKAGDNAGKPRGVIFITFTASEGKLAALELNGTYYRGKELKVTEATRSEEATPKTGNATGSKDAGKGLGFKVFVGALPYEANEKSVRSLFGGCGDIRDFFMPLNKSRKKEGHIQGYALITFETQAGMEMAISQHGKEINGRTLVVERKTGKEIKRDEPGVEVFEVFVGGLYSVSKKLIKQHFAACGEIESFEMPLTKAGESKGIAFIRYKTQESLDNALALNEKPLGLRTPTVERKVPKKEKDKDAKAEDSDEDEPVPKKAAKAAKAEPLDPHAAAILALQSAVDEDSCRAALDHARTLGITKKEEAFKRCKERLYGDAPKD